MHACAPPGVAGQNIQIDEKLIHIRHDASVVKCIFHPKPEVHMCEHITKRVHFRIGTGQELRGWCFEIKTLEGGRIANITKGSQRVKAIWAMVMLMKLIMANSKIINPTDNIIKVKFLLPYLNDLLCIS